MVEVLEGRYTSPYASSISRWLSPIVGQLTWSVLLIPRNASYVSKNAIGWLISRDHDGKVKACGLVMEGFVRDSVHGVCSPYA